MMSHGEELFAACVVFFFFLFLSFSFYLSFFFSSFRTSEDLEGDKPPPAPDQDLESNWIFLEHVQ